MKYFLGINQKLWFEQFPDADLETAAIFDFIRDFCATPSDKIKRLPHPDGWYTWINYDKIIEELPMLHFKSKGSISPRVEKLKKCGLIKTYQAPERSMYVMVTEKASELVFDDTVQLHEQGVHADEQGVQLHEQHNQTISNTTIKREAPPQKLKTPADEMRTFLLSVESTPAQFTPEAIKFASYWSERSKDGKHQRWEMEKTFELKRRMATWMSKAKGFQPGFQRMPQPSEELVYHFDPVIGARIKGSAVTAGLAEKMRIPNNVRTEVQEEASTEERRQRL
jgi:hypothetical protein